MHSSAYFFSFHFIKSILSIPLPFSYRDEHFYLTLMCSDTGIQTEIHRSRVDRSGFGKDSNQILETLAQHTQQAHTHTLTYTHTDTYKQKGLLFLRTCLVLLTIMCFFLFLYFPFQRTYFLVLGLINTMPISHLCSCK